jgi:hypothetical protein
MGISARKDVKIGQPLMRITLIICPPMRREDHLDIHAMLSMKTAGMMMQVKAGSFNADITHLKLMDDHPALYLPHHILTSQNRLTRILTFVKHIIDTSVIWRIINISKDIVLPNLCLQGLMAIPATNHIRMIHGMLILAVQQL